MAQDSSKNEQTAPSVPIIIDMGKTSKKKIRQFKKQDGPLLTEVNDAVELIKKKLGDDATGKEMLPIILIYKEKEKKFKLRFPL